jgi:hypothetical protein
VWLRVGNPAIDNSGSKSRNGAVAIRNVDVGNRFFQRVTAAAGRSYLFGLYARADSGLQIAQLRIDWLDGSGNPISTVTDQFTVDSEWNWLATRSKAPEGTIYASISAVPLGGTEIWLDDFSFISVLPDSN